jgi:hypothetical protein
MQKPLYRYLVLLRLPKGCIKALHVPYMVYGLVNSGLEMMEYTTHFDHWPKHDANIAMSCDNKNRWIFKFLAVLVYFGIFDVIEFHFLPPRHAHEKVTCLLTSWHQGMLLRPFRLTGIYLQLLQKCFFMLIYKFQRILEILIFHAFSYMAKFTVNTCLVIFD